MLKVLFIEDDPVQVMVIGAKFEIEGISYISAGNEKDALELATKEKPDLILLDILLGGENGLDIMEKFKKTKSVKDIPIIVFTNYAEKSAMDRAEKLGAVSFIIKSGVTPKKMVEIVKEYLKEKK